MYLKSYEALGPTDLTHLRSVLNDVCDELNLDINDPKVQPIAHDLVGLWLSGFRSADEMKAMLRPLT